VTINMCGCEAHKSLVDCNCGCDHSGDRISQWKARALVAEKQLATVREMCARPVGVCYAAESGAGYTQEDWINLGQCGR